MSNVVYKDKCPKVVYKKNLICVEKSGTITKVKLQKLKKHNQLYFGTFGISMIMLLWR